MINSSPNNSQQSDHNLFDNLHNYFIRRRQPKILIAGLTLVSLSILTYSGMRHLIRKNLPFLLSQQISKTLNRQVEIGEIQFISPTLTSIKFGLSSISPNLKNTNIVDIDSFHLKFNPLSFLFNRKLNTQIIIDKLDIQAKANSQGDWFNLEVEDVNLPIDLDIQFQIKQGDINLLNNHSIKPISIKFASQGKYQNNQISYNLDTIVTNSLISVKGKTDLISGTSKLALTTEKLSLPELISLISNFPMIVNQGEVKGNLGLDINSKKKQFKAKGKLDLSNVEGTIAGLEKSLQANAILRFNETEIILEEGNLTWGEITATSTGKIDLLQGFDLAIELNPLSLNQYQSTLPLAIDGKISGEFQLQGDWLNPILSGKLTNLNNLTINDINFATISLLFQSDLYQFTIKELKAIPVVGGELIATGVIDTQLRNSFNNNQIIELKKIPIDINFKTKLPIKAIASNYTQISQNIQLGNFQGEGFFQGSLNNPQVTIDYQISDANLPYLGNLTAEGKIDLRQDKIFVTQDIISPEEGIILVRGEADLSEQKWSSLITTSVKPISIIYDNQEIKLTESIVNITGQLDSLNQLDGYGNVNLNIDDSRITISSQFNSEKTTIFAMTSPLQIDKILPQFNQPINLTVNQAQFSTPSSTLISFLSQSEIYDLQAIDADIELEIGNIGGQNEMMNLTGKLKKGELELFVETANLYFPQLLPQKFPSVNITQGQISLKSDLEELVFNPSFNSLEAEAILELKLDNSKINLTTIVAENKWQTKITSTSFPISWLCEEVTQTELAANRGLNQITSFINYINKPKICSQNYFDVQLDFTAKLQPNLDFNHIPIETVTHLDIDNNNAQLTAQGNLILTDLINNPDIELLGLDVITNFPLNYILSETKGTANFQGKLEGKNLLIANNFWANLNLLGDLSIENLAIKSLIFEPSLIGKLQIVPQQKLGLELQGKEDKIIAWFEFCQMVKCQFSYIPTVLDLRQAQSNENSFFIIGKKENESGNFSLKMANFPLELFTITPATKWGINDTLQGIISGNLEINLYNLSSRGDIQVKTAGISNLNLDEINISFDYNPELELAQITSANLKFGESEYQFTGNLNLKSGAINAQLDIPQSRWEDLLTVLQISNIYSLVAFFSRQQLAQSLPEESLSYQLEYKNKSLGEQLNLLWKIDQQIKANAEKLKTAKSSLQLDLTGNYFGKITLAGTWYNPQLEFTIEGDNWQWQPHSSIIDLLPPLGLVVKQLPVIPVNNFYLSGKLGNGVLKIYPSKINISEASLSGQATLEKVGEDFTFHQTNFYIDNLSLDLIDNFLDIPIDIASKFDTNFAITGTRNNPQINGKFKIKETAISGRVVTEEIAGKFSYEDSLFSWQTNTESPIQINTNFVYSSDLTKIENLAIDINLLPNSIQILERLSAGSLTWVDGGGELKLKLRQENMNQPINVMGEMIFDNAIIQISPLSDQLNLNGKILLENQRLAINNLSAYLRDNAIIIEGILPLYEPLNRLTEKPLMITLNNGQLAKNKLYNGKIDGELVITGTAINPLIEGQINLDDGVIFLAPNKSDKRENFEQQNWVDKIVKRINLNNLNLAIKNTRLINNNIFDLNLLGEIKLNGNLGNIANLKPEGEIVVTDGEFDLFTNQLFITRRHQNKIIFKPEEGFFNPFLDLQLTTFLFNISLQPVFNQEIPDDIVKSGRAKNIEINIKIKGDTEQIFPSFVKAVDLGCEIKSNNLPPINQETINFKQLSECIRISAFAKKIDFKDLVFLPTIQLQSTPPLTQTEIYAILGKQSSSLFPAQVIELQSRNQSQLFQFGFTQIILAPLIQVVGFELNENINNITKHIGLSDFRVFPIIETNYQVGKESYLGLSYDYNFNEVQIRYHWQF